MPPKSAAAPRNRRKRQRKTRTLAVSSDDSSSSSSSSDSSSSASESGSEDEQAKNDKMNVDSSSDDSDSSSSASSETDSDSDSESDKAVKRSRVSSKPKPAASSATVSSSNRTKQPKRSSTKFRVTPEPDSDSSASSSDDDEDLDSISQAPRRPLPPHLAALVRKKTHPQSNTAASSATKIDRQQQRDQRTKAKSQNTEARRDAFKSLWLRSMADEFGDELDSIRNKEPTLGADGGTLLPLFIDALTSGSELFNPTSGASASSKAHNRTDEVALVINKP
ncbi:hypothetical protein BCV70DRAFT_200085 [Testicularia cyperi]|uniref:Ribosome assembly protein 3 n=1 Tax=Testicularia cyperi TaxID=1882483 RepID=A0A317XSE5_9BASI|nr:hypothetical protein BCV70DRAFT_200085 [Testicularia cyperi]